MPYPTRAGRPDPPSRVSHRESVMRAVAESRDIYVPAEQVQDPDEIRQRVTPLSELGCDRRTVTSVVAQDGARTSLPIRPGIPSVVYGFVQTSAAILDLESLSTQPEQTHIDPTRLASSVSHAAITLDFPIAGAYTRPDIDISRSWREWIDRLFRSRRIEVNGGEISLLDTLMKLFGSATRPTDSVTIACPSCDHTGNSVPISATEPIGFPCGGCGDALFPTDILAIHEEVSDSSENIGALTTLMNTVELLAMLGIADLLCDQHGSPAMDSVLFMADGPLATFGPISRLAGKARQYMQALGRGSPAYGPFVVGIEKNSAAVDFGQQLAENELLNPGELLTVDAYILGQLEGMQDPQRFGATNYWGRKFILRTNDGRLLVPSIMPAQGRPYDYEGGRPDPSHYPALPEILLLLDELGSFMHTNALAPIALADSDASFGNWLANDVLRLVAKDKLGL
jgi:hypothetical protein